MMRRRPGQRGEQGAVAVFVAILATLLMAMAALSVDLGNAWARKRAVQTQVDVSALSAGHLLPQTAATTNDIVDQVADYLNRVNNQVYGQSDVTRAQLLDGSLTNGEVIFSNGGKRMRVVSPAAHVEFGLAGVLGFDSAEVGATATVEIQSQIPQNDVFPFALPSGCPYGPGIADTEANGHASPTPSGEFSPATGEKGSHTIGPLSQSSSAAGTTVSISTDLSGLPNNSTGGVIRFRVGDSTIVNYPVSWAEVKNNTGEPRTVHFTVTTAVTDTPGTWNVWAIAGGGNKYSTASQPFTVTGAASESPSASVGCTTSASGNFGQLESPRDDEHRKPEAFAINIAKGLDHVVVPFEDPSSDDCGKNSPIPGASLDVDTTDGHNCLHTNNGNDGPKVMDGLVSGTGSVAGRLDVVNGTTRSGCGSNGSINGKTVNNDKLSCFLRNGATLNQIAQDSGVTEAMLDPAVTDSPRFVWLPVVYSTNRSGAEFQPIKTFVPAFITDETAATPASSKNGVTWSGNKVSSIQVFSFNAMALPIDERDPSTSYDPNQRSIVRLID